MKKFVGNTVIQAGKDEGQLQRTAEGLYETE